MSIHIERLFFYLSSCEIYSHFICINCYCIMAHTTACFNLIDNSQLDFLTSSHNSVRSCPWDFGLLCSCKFLLTEATQITPHQLYCTLTRFELREKQAWFLSCLQKWHLNCTAQANLPWHTPYCTITSIFTWDHMKIAT